MRSWRASWDWIGLVTAREGDMVRMGGGESDGVWETCGMFEVEPPPG
jgi:hypothetical protein